MSITFPVRLENGTEDTVEVLGDQLPTEEMEHMQFVRKLEAVRAPRRVYNAVALEYHRRGHSELFRATLERACDALPPPDDLREEERHAAAEMYTNLAADLLGRSGTSEKELRQNFVDLFQKAQSYHENDVYKEAIGAFFMCALLDRQAKDDSQKTRTARANLHKRAVERLGTMDFLANRKDPGKYTFIRNAAWGLYNFHKGNYSKSLDNLLKAVSAKPDSGAGMRVAIATCCFRLEKYSRAGAALESAVGIEPSNINALVGMGLFKRQEAGRDKSKRIEHRLEALDFFSVVEDLDQKCYAAMLHIANHDFFTWKSIDKEATVKDGGATIVISGNYEKELGRADESTNKEIVTNPLKIDSWANVEVLSAEVEGENTRVTVGKAEQEFIGALGKTTVQAEMKFYAEVQGRATKILADKNKQSSASEEIKAEAFYMLGRLMHASDFIGTAEKCYRRVFDKDPSMVLAAFGLGQIYLGQEKYDEALEKFEHVLKVATDDRDTTAYIILTKSLANSAVVNYDKVKEVANGFAHETDLWLLQAQNRFKSGAEFQNALKCYENALKCDVPGGLRKDVIINAYGNMAVLCHSMGNLNKAVMFARKSLDHDYTDEKQNPIFTHAENDIFFRYSDVVGSATASGKRFTVKLDSGESPLTVGDDILLDDVLHKVCVVDRNHVETKCALSTPNGKKVAVRRKIARHNFNDRTFILCYNYSRILEDQGSSVAAREIYDQLLVNHPSFTECYLRLSCMAREMGNFDEAEEWLQKALNVNPDEPDARVSLGDLYARRGEWDKAKKMYDEVNSKDVQESELDARTMISQGNLYHRSLSDNQHYNKNLKQSYKFYHMVLNKYRTNAYATNGLGMICAEMKRYDAAREMFSRARESNITAAEDISTNLAHVHLFQNKSVDAITLYQSAMKATLASGRASRQYGPIVECLALARHRSGQYDEAQRVLKQAIHCDPTIPHSWFNFGYVIEKQASSLVSASKKGPMVDEIGTMQRKLETALGVFGFASTTDSKAVKYDQKKAQQHLTVCNKLQQTLTSAMEKAHERDRLTLESKRKRDELRRVHIEERARVQAEKAEKEALAKDEERAKALAIKEHLSELSKSWAKEPVKAAGKKKRKKGDLNAPTDDFDDGPAIFDSDSETENVVTKNTGKSDEAVMGLGLDDSDDDVPPPPPAAAASADIQGDGDGDDELFGSDDDALPAAKSRRIVDDE